MNLKNSNEEIFDSEIKTKSSSRNTRKVNKSAARKLVEEVITKEKSTETLTFRTKPSIRRKMNALRLEYMQQGYEISEAYIITKALEEFLSEVSDPGGDGNFKLKI